MDASPGVSPFDALGLPGEEAPRAALDLRGPGGFDVFWSAVGGLQACKKLCSKIGPVSFREIQGFTEDASCVGAHDEDSTTALPALPRAADASWRCYDLFENFAG